MKLLQKILCFTLKISNRSLKLVLKSRAWSFLILTSDKKVGLDAEVFSF